MKSKSRKSKKVEVKLLRLDLGCGQRKQEGHIGVDIHKGEGVDVVLDLRRTPWPWKANSIESVYSAHFLEHLTGPERITFMDELYRVLRVGGTALFITPYYANMRAVQDPTHAWPPLCEASYLYFNKGWREQNGLTHYLGSCDFDFSYGYSVTPATQGRAEEQRNHAIMYYWNAVSDLHVTLTKREGDKK